MRDNTRMTAHSYCEEHRSRSERALQALVLAERIMTIIDGDEKTIVGNGIGSDRMQQGYASLLQQMRGDDIVHTKMSRSAFNDRLSRVSFVFAGVEAALEWLVENYKKTYGIDVDIRKDGVSVEIDKRIGYFIFLAVHELLENAVHHAKATHVLVSIIRCYDTMHINVRDDGAGFEPVLVVEQGLAGIREKAGYLGGSFAIESKPGRCTHARITVPLYARRH